MTNLSSVGQVSGSHVFTADLQHLKDAREYFMARSATAAAKVAKRVAGGIEAARADAKSAKGDVDAINRLIARIEEG